MKENIKNSLKESFLSILPVLVVSCFLCLTIAPVSIDVFVMLLVGTIFLIFGMSLFTLGAETSMNLMGEKIGSYVSSRKKFSLTIFLVILIGIIVVFAEPDLMVFAEQVHGIPTFWILGTVAIGGGLLLAASFIRVRLGIKLRYILMALYGLCFTLAFFVPESFWTIAFDAGGVSTGTISVPFIVAIGAGATFLRSDKEAENDSFGLLAICSAGPVIAMLVLGLFYEVSGFDYAHASIGNIENSANILDAFISAIPIYMKEVAMSLLPVLLIFFVFRFFAFKISKEEMKKILIGVAFVYIGLVLFFTGANVGFMPAGSLIGEALASNSYYWIVIPIGMILGYLMVKAEPAVVVLVKQISDITDGSISEKLMMFSQEIGISIAIGLCMVRIITGISILWILIPCYVLAFILSFITPEIFTAIAFDSGGVSSGTMTAVFLIPFSIGVCTVLGGDIMADAFGVVAVAAAAPVVCTQLIGIMYKHKLNKQKEVLTTTEAEEIIELDWMWANE